MKRKNDFIKVALTSIIVALFTLALTNFQQRGFGKASAAWDITVYQDSLVTNWKNWSWGSLVNLNNTSTKYGGSYSIKFDPNAWGALYLHNDTAVSFSEHRSIQFQLKSSENNQKFQVIFYDSDNKTINTKLKLSDFGGATSKDKWTEYNIPFSKVSSSISKIKGFAIQESLGIDQPAVYIDHIYIKAVSSGSTPTSTPTLTVTPTPTPTPTSSTPTPTPTPTSSTPTPTPTPVPSVNTNPTTSGYSTSKGTIYKDGKSIRLKGVSWFGFEGSSHVVHGLWARNWKEMIAQMKSLGFNSVRIPICPKTIDGVSPTSIDYSKNSDLKGLNSLQILDKVMNEFNRQGMYVLLDHHTIDCNSISDLWYTSNYSEDEWINDLKFVAQRYKNLPFFLGIDLKNEPKGAATWGTGNKSTDWNLAAEKAGKEVLSVNSNLLIFVQGVTTNPIYSSNTAHFWGGNLEPAAKVPIDSNAIPSNKLVFSPHVYGPDVYMQSYFTESSFPSNMPAIWDKHFGYLVDKGYTIVPGEWGGKYGNGGDAKDVTWHNSIVSYFKSKNILNSYYWDWNPNSTDTGGILKDDWKTPWPNKMELLNSYYSQ